MNLCAVSRIDGLKMDDVVLRSWVWQGDSSPHVPVLDVKSINKQSSSSVYSFQSCGWLSSASVQCGCDRLNMGWIGGHRHSEVYRDTYPLSFWPANVVVIGHSFISRMH